MNTTTDLPAPGAATAFLDREHRLLIGGRWVASTTGQIMTSVNPATGRPLATLARGGAAGSCLAIGGYPGPRVPR